MKPPARIRLRLMGRLTLAFDDEGANAIRLSTRKAGALVAYLAMSPDQTATRSGATSTAMRLRISWLRSTAC